MKKTREVQKGCHHIRHDGNNKLKGTDTCSLKRTPIVLTFLSLVVGNMSIYVENVGWERILPLKIYSNFTTWKSIVVLFAEWWDINFQIFEDSL